MLRSAFRNAAWTAGVVGTLFTASSAMSQEVSQSGSVLTVRGDTDRDDVTIVGTGPGNVTVTNNQGGDSEDYTGVDTVQVDLRTGDDTLSISNLDLSQGGVGLAAPNFGFVNVKLGFGEDEVFVSGTINADALIDGEAESDDIDLSAGVTVVGSLGVYGGLRDDEINLTGVGVGVDLLVDAQGGDDELLFSGLLVNGLASIDLGAGNDYAAGTGATFTDDAQVIAGLGDDTIENSANVYSGSLYVELRGGDDDYSELAANIAGDYSVDGGPGNDNFDDTGTIVGGTRTVNRVE